MDDNFKDIGAIIGIFSANKAHVGPIRPSVKKLELIKNHGIKNDKFAEKNLNSTVMIIDINSYNLAKRNDIMLQYGSLGENILFDFGLNSFKVGTIFKIEDAKIEITQKCTICNHLSVFDKNLPKLIKNDRGMYCKIIKSGLITKGMKVKVYEKI